jgi:DNA replication initiation complex subunit (GINS family)
MLRALSDYLVDLPIDSQLTIYNKFLHLLVYRDIYAVQVDKMIPQIFEPDYLLPDSQEFRDWIQHTLESESADILPLNLTAINFAEITNDNYEELALMMYGVG